MTPRPLIAFALAALFAGGCSTLGENGKRQQEINSSIAELRASVEDLNSRMEEMNNKFALLHEKVEANRGAVDKGAPVAGAAELGFMPGSPPEGLKVVRLEDEGGVGGGGGGVGGGEAGEAVKPEKAPVETQKKPGERPSKAKRAGKKPVKTHPPSSVGPANAGAIEGGPQVKAAKAASAPDALYNTGQDLFMSGRFPEARAVFSELVRAYPQSPLADNALYWIGESHYTEKDFNSALSTFKEVLDRYPGENKAPDALYKIALSYAEMTDGDKARETLEAVVKRYPDSEAAVNAKKTLKKLTQTGRTDDGQKRKD